MSDHEERKKRSHAQIKAEAWPEEGGPFGSGNAKSKRAKMLGLLAMMGAISGDLTALDTGKPYHPDAEENELERRKATREAQGETILPEPSQPYQNKKKLSRAQRRAKNNNSKK